MTTSSYRKDILGDDRLRIKAELIKLSKPGHEDPLAIGKLVLSKLGMFLEAIRRMD